MGGGVIQQDYVKHHCGIAVDWTERGAGRRFLCGRVPAGGERPILEMHHRARSLDDAGKARPRKLHEVAVMNRQCMLATFVLCAARTAGGGESPPADGTHIVFRACPVAQDTGPDTDLCFFAMHRGIRYGLRNPPDWYLMATYS